MPPIGLGVSLGVGGGKSATSSGAPGGGASSPLLIYTITNTGSAFYLRSSGTVDYTVDWGDGDSETSVSNALLHTYAASGTYTINVSSDVAYRPYFANSGATGEDQITSIEIQDGINLGTTLYNAWQGAQNMTAFVASNATSTVANFMQFMFRNSGLTSFPLMDTSSGTNFNQAWYLCSGLTSFPLLDTSNVLIFSHAWRDCGGLTSFPLLDVGIGTNFSHAWYSCNSLTSFPALNTSAGTDFTNAWVGCTGLTSFPLLDVSSGTNFTSTWQGVSGLTSFPLLDVSSGTNFASTWRLCTGLTSFPLLDVSSGTNFNRTWGDNGVGFTIFPALDLSSATTCTHAWYACSGLATFPANMFDTTGTLAPTAFTNAWKNCALTAQSIENILVSLVANTATNKTLTLDGGTNAGYSTWSPAAVTAFDTLETRGWTIAKNA